MNKTVNFISSLLILTAIWLALPLKSIHDCNNLSLKKDYTLVTENHQDCNICDISLNSTDPGSAIISKPLQQYPKPNSSTVESFISTNEIVKLYLRGPPAII